MYSPMMVGKKKHLPTLRYSPMMVGKKTLAHPTILQDGVDYEYSKFRCRGKSHHFSN